MAAQVLVVGEALVDIVERPGRPATEHVGGSPANVAMGLARLGHPTELLACVGDDARGQSVVEHLAGHDVALTGGSVRPGPTSTARARIGDDGAATYDFELTWTPDLTPLAHSQASVAHVHTGSLATALPPGADDVMAALKSVAGSVTISYDPNIRPSIVEPADALPRVEEIVALSAVVKASDEDASLLYPGLPLAEVVARWLDLGAGLVVVTLGPKGVTWASASGATGSAPTRAATVVDTVGAGDSFMAGMLSGLLDADLLGGPGAADALRHADATTLEAAVGRGLATSALTVARPGAYAPTRSEFP